MLTAQSIFLCSTYKIVHFFLSSFETAVRFISPAFHLLIIFDVSTSRVLPYYLNFAKMVFLEFGLAPQKRILGVTEIRR